MGEIKMAAGTNRFAIWMGAGVLLGALLLFPTGAGAVSLVLEGLSETGCLVKSWDDPGAKYSCVIINSSRSWGGSEPGWAPSTFNVDYTVDPGDDVAGMEIVDFEIPELNGGGAEDIFKIMSDPYGTFDTSTGSIQLSFDLVINRNGYDSDPFTYSISTGTESAVCPGGGTIEKSGWNHGGFGPNWVLLVGSQCVDVARVGDPPDWRYMTMSLWGTVPVPVPEPSTWSLMALGLAALAYRSRRRGW